MSGTRAASSSASPPAAPRREHRLLRHGEVQIDHYSWLQDKQAAETLAYLQAENDFTAAATAELEPFSAALYSEMLSRIKQTDLSVPQRRGAWYYYSRTVEGLQYGLSCRRRAAADGQDDPEAPEQVLLDLNQLAEGHPYLGLGAFEISEDGTRLAYTTDESGFRQYRLHVLELETGVTHSALMERVTSVAWANDGETLLVTTEDSTTKRSDTLLRLKLGGTPELVYHEADPLFRIGIGKTRDACLLVLGIYSTDSWEQRLIPANRPTEPPRTVLPRAAGHKYEVDHREGLLYIRTNRDALDFRVVTAPPDDPSPARWTEWLAHQSAATIKAVDLFRRFAVISVKQEGLMRFRVHDFATGGWHELEFPEAVYCAVAADNPEYDTTAFRYSYQTLIHPPAVYDHDLVAHRRTLRKQQEVLGGYDPASYATERVWAATEDGQRIPLSIAYRRGLPRDGSAPLLLYGYGAYGLGLSAAFASTRISLLDRGFVFAIAHVRGGDELGEAWRIGGMLMQKRNSFTDFIRCAEQLIALGFTSSDRLLAQGGSAGGLLIGAVINFRPELFHAVHAAVPFVDVLNTMCDESLPLTIGEYLEWGDPREELAFAYIRSYSPYDNLKPTAYPAILVTTSINDSQVMYWEPAKWVAKLRTVKHDQRPLLLKTNLAAGHSGASGRYDRLREIAFETAWLMWQVGVRS